MVGWWVDWLVSGRFVVYRLVGWLTSDWLVVRGSLIGWWDERWLIGKWLKVGWLVSGCSAG